ncbi:MAG: SGNH/GDSL hydrolase family protein [Deltaproteobacteria bacterium]|nr:SGNH/GDSL hydrolase family protein [Deltaproteobacteria bacterium]
MKKLKEISLNLILLLVSVAFFLLIAEFATRYFWNAGYRHSYDWRDRTEGYSFEKGRDVYRILSVGDSVTYGQGVSREETFSKLIEEQLNKSLQGRNNKKNRKYEVVNIGWPGLNTADEYKKFISVGVNYKPDLIIWNYYLNDLGKPSSFKLNYLKHPTYIRRPLNRPGWPWKLPIPVSVDKYLTLNSDLYLFLLTKYDQILSNYGIRKHTDHNARLLEQYSRKGDDWLYMKRVLERVLMICNVNETNIAFVIIPYFHEMENYKLDGIHTQLTETAVSIGYHYTLDLLPFFKDKKNEQLIVSRIDTHPNGIAHKIMADNIVKFLKENNLVEN